MGLELLKGPIEVGLVAGRVKGSVCPLDDMAVVGMAAMLVLYHW